VRRFERENRALNLECEWEFGYSHGGGYMYYARCRGWAEYPMTPEGVAKSMRDLNELLKRMSIGI